MADFQEICTVENHANLVKDTDIPSNSIVFGQSPNLIIKENKLL